jgi:protein tyrosine/serine phosphatase
VRKAFAWVAFATLTPAALVGGYILAIQNNKNFDTVVQHELYRSAQPSATDIARFVDEDHIASIVNLRGQSSGAPWYDEEIAASDALELKHYDFPMSASNALTHQEAVDLIALLLKAEKPVLIHCNWGADRTGLASALYLAAIAKASEEKAEAQLSLRYGHFSVPVLSQAFAMDETFESLEEWLGNFDP